MPRMPRVSCMDCAYMSACSASNDLLSFPHINNSRTRYGESSKGPKTPHPTPTIQACPESTSEEPAYNPMILRMDAIQISQELSCMLHPTISRHHPSMLVLTSCWNSHQGRPYLAVLSITLGLITLHIAVLYCATDMWTISLHLCPITTFRAKNQKDSKMPHTLYTQLPHFAIFVSKFYFDTNFTP